MPGTVAVLYLEPKPFTLQSASDATDTGIDIDLGGRYGSLTVQVVGVAWTGTLDFYQSQNGSNFIAARGVDVNTGGKASQVSADGIWKFDVTGIAKFRSLHTRTGGSVTVTATATAAVPNQQ